jgi:hypothetical protein
MTERSNSRPVGDRSDENDEQGEADGEHHRCGQSAHARGEVDLPALGQDALAVVAGGVEGGRGASRGGPRTAPPVGGEREPATQDLVPEIPSGRRGA